MAQVLVRDLDEEVVERLKARARAHSRSLEGELRVVLEQAARSYVDMTAIRAGADEIRRQLQGRSHTDSTELLAEDRAR
ncbi:MAG TPA: Arc family DNA-binding protein [Isosphaeraceae bacterium]|jgi:plasmid stability protein|nr:Arc family DNA-binding protein [Isosphaeraceae bacterium]